MSAASIERGLRIVRGLFAWLHEVGYLAGNPWAAVATTLKSHAQFRTAGKARNKGAEKSLSREEWAAVLGVIDAMPAGERKARAVALVRLGAMAGLRREYSKLAVLPVVADFTKPFDLPDAVRIMPRVGFFPGSTIGNFEPHEAAAFLSHAGRILGRGATFIVGVDLVKDAQVLKKAYNDSQGITANFNLNLLTRINRELGAKFNPACFEHHAFFNRDRSRIEMHLASLKRQRIKVCGECIDFRAGETIHTENSYKYSVESLGALARGAGWTPVAAWTDPDKYFSVHALRLKG